MEKLYRHFIMDDIAGLRQEIIDEMLMIMAQISPFCEIQIPEANLGYRYCDITRENCGQPDIIISNLLDNLEKPLAILYCETNHYLYLTNQGIQKVLLEILGDAGRILDVHPYRQTIKLIHTMKKYVAYCMAASGIQREELSLAVDLTLFHQDLWMKGQRLLKLLSEYNRREIRDRQQGGSFVDRCNISTMRRRQINDLLKTGILGFIEDLYGSLPETLNKALEKNIELAIDGIIDVFMEKAKIRITHNWIIRHYMKMCELSMTQEAPDKEMPRRNILQNVALAYGDRVSKCAEFLHAAEDGMAIADGEKSVSLVATQIFVLPKEKIYQCPSCKGLLSFGKYNIPIFTSNNLFHSYRLVELGYCYDCNHGIMLKREMENLLYRMNARISADERYIIKPRNVAIRMTAGSTRFLYAPTIDYKLFSMDGTPLKKLIIGEAIYDTNGIFLGAISSGNNGRTGFSGRLRETSFLKALGYDPNLPDERRHDILREAVKIGGKRYVICLLQLRLDTHGRYSGTRKSPDYKIRRWEEDLQYVYHLKDF